MKKFVVTVVDIGESSNYVPHCLGIFDNREDAKKLVQEEMNSMIESTNGMEYELDEVNLIFRTNDLLYGAVWNIEEIEK